MESRRAAPGPPSQGSAVGAGSAAELVYHLAGALGTELQELARRFGPNAAAGLVPLVVRALELLEKAAVGPAPDSLQVSAQQAELELRRLHEENQRLRRELGSGPQEERALLRQLKEVTDRQRDELRAHSRDLMRRSQETEALQEQLQRLLLVNSELRHKLAAVQTQLRAAQDRERERQIARDGSHQLAEEQRLKPEAATPDDRMDAQQRPEHPPEAVQCGFSREELQQILQERNELKANVFLLKEELAYFQRELLTDHRVPGLLLEAMKVAVKRQRKKIKAKMLGTPEEAESSDDEDDSWLLLSNDKDDAPLVPGSRIQNLYVGGGEGRRRWRRDLPGSSPPLCSARLPSHCSPASVFPLPLCPKCFQIPVTVCHPLPPEAPSSPLSAFSLHPDISAFSLHPDTSAISLHPKISAFSLYPKISAFSLHPKISAFSLHPDTSAFSLHPDISPGFPSSFGLWYRGETEAPESETSNTAPSRLQEGEETPQQPHMEPVGSLPAPNS